MQPKACPFLRWAGGKTQLLPELRKRIPKTWNPETDLYYEPFLGGGALFWDLQPKFAILSDANVDLIEAWRAVQDRFDALVTALRRRQKDYRRDPQNYYYMLRNGSYSGGEVGAAARTIFLNKTCFNGLYRVNKDGKFNVPWGKNPKAVVLDEENLSACTHFLNAPDRRVWLGHLDFTEAIKLSGEIAPRGGELFYLDPPYVPASKTANFTAFTVDGFKYVDQLRLVQHAVWLRDCGAHVILSQAADESLVEQYRRCGFKCDLVSARRAVNSKVSKRGPVGEYIIYGG